ncbi:TrmH family RNA methyltransferase [Mycobacterium riyadhense]|uniref:TrmH family RNA methyltransferase n=1 Tax=Mycobacterium riyadhense TaxID=486698 RepID=UPI001EF9CB69|nr:TrmH family RNA methyltransferase [Mycobacterium riyadhense]
MSRAPGASSAPRIRTRQEIHRQRRPRRHRCWNHLVGAPLWPKYGANLCSRCAPATPWARAWWCQICVAWPKRSRRATPCGQDHAIHWIYGDVGRWLRRHSDETQVVGVEFTDESIRLDDLPAARTRTVVVLGNEGYGIPPEAVDKLDLAVEIPMVGAGHSLNVAVAASLVLYTLAGLL